MKKQTSIEGGGRGFELCLALPLFKPFLGTTQCPNLKFNPIFNPIDMGFYFYPEIT